MIFPNGFEYTVATGRLFCDFAVFQSEAESLLGEPIYTHEFGKPEVWERLRAAMEDRLLTEAGV